MQVLHKMSDSGNSKPRVMIEARNASKLLPDGVASLKKAFVNLDLNICQGDRIALFSVNSFESRVLLDCLSGVDKPDQGDILHYGSVSWPLGSNQAFHRRLSGYMNARFAAEVYSQPGRIEKDLRLIQDLIGADDFTFHQPLGTWNAPMRKWLELAVSLAFEFDATLVGRISNWDHRALHPASVRMRELFEQRIDGRTLLVAAPGQNRLALDYCDEGLVILNGRLVYRGDPEVCLLMVKEETQRLRYERRQRVNARISRLVADSNTDECNSDDPDLDDVQEAESEPEVLPGDRPTPVSPLAAAPDLWPRSV